MHVTSHTKRFLGLLAIGGAVGAVLGATLGDADPVALLLAVCAAGVLGAFAVVSLER